MLQCIIYCCSTNYLLVGPMTYYIHTVYYSINNDLLIVLSASGEEPHKLQPHPYRSMLGQSTCCRLGLFITWARAELGADEARYTRCNFATEWPVSGTTSTIVGLGF